MNCDFAIINGRITCPVCGRRPRIVIPGLPLDRYHYPCGEKQNEPAAVARRAAAQVADKKLGDKVEAVLESIGITPDRYTKAKELFGLPPTCGCSKRKEWLNKVSDWWRGESPAQPLQP